MSAGEPLRWVGHPRIACGLARPERACRLTCEFLFPHSRRAAIWNSHPKAYGKGGRRCRVSSNQGGIIRKYGLNICRQAFRELATEIGFVKYR